MRRCEPSHCTPIRSTATGTMSCGRGQVDYSISIKGLTFRRTRLLGMAGAAFPVAVDLAVLRLGFDRVAVLVEMTMISAVTLMRAHLILPRRMVHAVMVRW